MGATANRHEWRLPLILLSLVGHLIILSGCGNAPEQDDDQAACNAASHIDQPRANIRVEPAIPTASAPCVIRMTAYTQKRSPVRTIIGVFETRSPEESTQSESLRFKLQDSGTGMKSATLEIERGDSLLCHDLELTLQIDACTSESDSNGLCPSIRVLKEDTIAALDIFSRTSTVCYD